MTRIPTEMLSEEPPAWFFPPRQPANLTRVSNASAPVAAPQMQGSVAPDQTAALAQAAQQPAPPPVQQQPPSVQTFEEFNKLLDSSPDPAGTFAQLMDTEWQKRTPEERGRVYESWVHDKAARDSSIYGKRPWKKIAERAQREMQAAFPELKFDAAKYELYVKAQRAAEVLSNNPDIGIGEYAIAAETPPEMRRIVAGAVRRQYLKDQTNKTAGRAARLNQSLIRGAIDYAMPLAKMTGAAPVLDAEQERFAQELAAIRAGADPLVRPDDNWFITGLHGAERQVFPMASSIAAGSTVAQGAQLAVTGGRVAGVAGGGALGAAGEKAASVGMSAGVAGSFLPQIADDTYKQAVGEGNSPAMAAAITAISSPLEAAAEAIMPNPFKGAKGLGQGSWGSVIRKVVTEYVKRFAGEWSEEGVQGGIREAGMEVLRGFNEKVPSKGPLAIPKASREAMRESFLPLAMMLAPSGVSIAAQAGMERTGQPTGSQNAQDAPGSVQPVVDSAPVPAPETAPAGPVVAPSAVEAPIPDTVSEKAAEPEPVSPPVREQLQDPAFRDDLVAHLKAKNRRLQDADADDIASDAIVYALEHEADYDPAKMPLDKWVKMKARGLASNRRRTLGSRREVPVVEEPVAPAEAEPLEPMSRDDLTRMSNEDLAGKWRQTHPRAKKEPPTDKGSLVRQIWAKLPKEMRAEPEKPARKNVFQKPQPAGEVAPAREAEVPVAEVLRKYNEQDLYTEGDAVNELESLDIPELRDAISNYRKAEDESRELGERMDVVGDAFAPILHIVEQLSRGTNVVKPTVATPSPIRDDWKGTISSATTEKARDAAIGKAVAAATTSDEIRAIQEFSKTLPPLPAQPTAPDLTRVSNAPTAQWAAVPEGVDVKSTLKDSGIAPDMVEYSSDYKQWRLKPAKKNAFAKPAKPVETLAPVPAETNANVLAAVRKVANASGRARIADVQAALPELSAKEVADALLQMERSEEAILEGLDDPREITQRDKEAAVPNSLGHPRQIVFLGPKASAPEAAVSPPAPTLGKPAKPKKPKATKTLAQKAEQPKADWKQDAIAAVKGHGQTDPLTLAELRAKLSPDLSLSEFKAGLWELHAAGEVKLHEHTRAPAEIKKKIDDLGNVGDEFLDEVIVNPNPKAMVSGERMVYYHVSESPDWWRERRQAEQKPATQTEEKFDTRVKSEKAVKQPWEMTREEWHDAELAKIPAQMKATGNFKAPSLNDHKRAVRGALLRGQQVPAAVLADYPDLQPKPPQPTLGKKATQPRKSALKSPETGARKALAPSQVQALNAMASDRSVAPWSNTPPTTATGKSLLNRLQNDKHKKVGLRSIFQMIGDAFGTLTIVGKSQLSGSTPAHYEPRPHVVRSKSGQTMFDWHEQGHALSRLLTDVDANWMAEHSNELLALTAMQNNQASAETAEEGMAEFVRRYITHYQSLPVELRQAMEQKIGDLAPEFLQTLKDANRAYAYHNSRPISERLQADRNDRGKPKPMLTGMRNAMVNILTQVFGGEVAIHFNAVLPVARAVAKHSRAAYDQLMQGSKGKKADLYNAWANTLLAPAESIRLLVGDRGGKQGVRVFAWGDEMLSQEDADAMREAGLPIPEDLNVRHGDWLYITDKSFQDIRDKLGDNWGGFEAYGQARASMERLTKGMEDEDGKPHLPPWLAEGKTIEDVQEFIDQTAAAHPEWGESFRDVQQYFDGLLVVSTLNGEFSPAEAIVIKQAWEDYWPLQRVTESTDAGGGAGKGGGMDISSGAYRAFGSALPFKSLIEAAEYRTKHAMQSFYQNRLRKSMLEWDKLVSSIDAPPSAKTLAARLMIPLRMDREVAAKVSPAEQQTWFAEELARVMNEQREEDLGRPLEADEVLAPDDIDVNLPWRNVYRAKKPGAVQVVGVYEGGNIQYYQVTDPLIYDTLSRTKDTRAWLKWLVTVGVKSVEPWKRAMTQNLLFAARNISTRDQLTAYSMGEGLKSLIPGRYGIRGFVGHVTGQTKADPSPRMVLYSRTLEDLNQPRHKQLWKRFTRSLGEAATEGWYWGRIPGWSDMTLLERVAELPGIMSSAALWPVTMFNYGTGGRLLSQMSEDLTREGAWLAARDRGASAETASRAAAEITGNFAQRQPNAGFRTFVRMAGFLNPSLQIMWGYGRRMTSADIHERHLMWAKAPIAAAWGAMGAAINVALIMALYSQFKPDDDDEDTLAMRMLNNMREQTDSERRTTMSVMGIARLPFEPGGYGAMFSFGWNMMQDWLLESKPDTGKRLGELAKNTASLPGPYDMLQPYLKTAMEVNLGAGGFSFYRNEEIVPAHLRTYHPLEPEKQVFENTPELYKRLHRAIGGHPLKWEYALRALFTRQLTDSIAFIDGLNKTGKFQAQNLPILRGLVTSTATGNRSASVQKLRAVSQQVEAMASQLKDMKDDKARAALESQLKDLHQAHIAFSAIDELWQQAKELDAKEGGDKSLLKQVEQQMTSFGRQFLDWQNGVRKQPPQGFEEAKEKWLGTKVHAVTEDQYAGDGSELEVYGYSLEQAQAAYRMYYANRFNGIWDAKKEQLKEAYTKRLARLSHLMSGLTATWTKKPKPKKGFALPLGETEE